MGQPQVARPMPTPEHVAGFEPVELIPLDQAVLCEICHVINRGKNHHCLSCGAFHLAGVLGREENSISAIRPSPAEAEL